MKHCQQEMTVIQNAWPVVCNFGWLIEADRNARKGKRYRAEVLNFTARLEDNLFTIQQGMMNGSYVLGPYRKLWVYVPKKRLVMALDYPDRIVQWSLYLYLNPLYDRLFIEDSYACRKGKGSHKAAKRLQYWMCQVQRKPGPGWYCLKLDISKYFYRVNHEKLLAILGRRVKDPAMMAFIRGVVNSRAEPFGLPRWRTPQDTPPEEWLYEVGMPIGNLTSQLFANIYLNELDQYCKHRLKIHYYIEKWLKMGMKPREVADKLRVHVSTIYRELKRGAYDRLDGGTWEVETAYSPDIAEEKYQAHLREKGPDLKIGNDHELANYIETTILDKDCSPAAVLGFAMIEGKKFKTSLSVPTIYKYIAKGLFLNLTQEELPRHGKKKHKYKKVKKNKSASRAPAGESIEQRPEEIDGREEFGHWEGDTVYSGKGKRKTTRALLTMTERKTRKEIIIAIPNRKAETVVKALDALERKLGARRFRAIFKSITFDNGTEFAAAEELERSCINKHLPRTKVYFCHPYSSWERGTNENTNGMIRRRFPKGTNFAAVTNAQITQAENWINNYPRKILGYKSSEIVFRECLRELGIAA